MGVRQSAAVVADPGEHSGAELNAESGKADDGLSVRVLTESLFDRLSQVIDSRARGFQLDKEGEHLFAECLLDEQRLMGPASAADVLEPFGVGLDAALAAGLPA